MQNKALLIIVLSFLLFGCMKKGAYVGTEWQKHTSVEYQGFDSKKLQELTEYVDRVGESTGLMVIYDGKVLYENGDLSEVSYIASCRKSILSILYGKYVEDKTIDLSQNIGELGIDDRSALLPSEKQATIGHLITSRSGVYHPAANSGYDDSFAKMRGKKNAGETFVYNNWDFNVAGYVFEKLVNKSIYQEIEEQLAIPLGFQDWHLDNQSKYGDEDISLYPAYHIYLSTRDMAKVGQLMLNRGKWKDKQVISEFWVVKSTTPVTSQKEVAQRYDNQGGQMPDFSYSYMWWNFDEFNGDKRYKGAFMASGYGGQFILVIPEMKLVIAHKSNVSGLVKLGLFKGGVANATFQKMADMVMNAKTK